MGTSSLQHRSKEALRWLHFPTISSTHLFAKEHCAELDRKTGEVDLKIGFEIKALITCDEQTQGVGRRGNFWQSRVGDLLATYLVKFSTRWPSKLSGQIALMATCALFDALSPFFGESMHDFWIKWPNDLYFKDRKIAGVMAELVNERAVALLSVGVNLAQKEGLCHLQMPFPEKGGTEGQLSAQKLAAQLTRSLQYHLQGLSKSPKSTISPHYFGNRLQVGTRLTFYRADMDQLQSATYLGIDRFGRLIALSNEHLVYLGPDQVHKLQIKLD